MTDGQTDQPKSDLHSRVSATSKQSSHIMKHKKRKHGTAEWGVKISIVWTFIHSFVLSPAHLFIALGLARSRFSYKISSVYFRMTASRLFSAAYDRILARAVRLSSVSNNEHWLPFHSSDGLAWRWYIQQVLEPWTIIQSISALTWKEIWEKWGYIAG